MGELGVGERHFHSGRGLADAAVAQACNRQLFRRLWHQCHAQIGGHQRQYRHDLRRVLPHFRLKTMGKTGGAYRIKQTRTHRGRRHDKKVVLQQQQRNFGHCLARVLGRQGHHHGFGEQNLHVQIGRGGLRRAHNRNVQLIVLQTLQQNQRIGLRQLQLDVGVLLLVQPYHAAQQWMQHGCACVA